MVCDILKKREVTVVAAHTQHQREKLAPPGPGGFCTFLENCAACMTSYHATKNRSQQLTENRFGQCVTVMTVCLEKGTAKKNILTKKITSTSRRSHWDRERR
mgnify:CR=1 FL=1